MFFWASKILWIFFKPLTLIGLIMVAGLLLGIWFKRLGRMLLTTGIVLFLAIGFLPIGPNMMSWLETHYKQPILPPDVDGIIVLGGMFDTYLSARTNQMVVNDNFERMIAFVDLAYRYPNAKLVFSGGAGNFQEQTRTESVDAREYLETIRFPVERVLFEDKSRNTYENAAYSKALIQPKEDEIWVVITSASHMRRSVAVFEKAGWHVMPYPVDPDTPLDYGRANDPINVLKNFRSFEEATREVIGRLVYQLKGMSQ